MANLSPKTKWDFHTEGPSLTEQEHKDSCDINIMLKRALRGQDIRMSSAQAVYGKEDMNVDLVQHLIRKEQLEKELSEFAKNNELSEEEAMILPPDVKKKFAFKVRKKDSKKEEPLKNDDQTTKNKAPNESPQ